MELLNFGRAIRFVRILTFFGFVALFFGGRVRADFACDLALTVAAEDREKIMLQIRDLSARKLALDLALAKGDRSLLTRKQGEEYKVQMRTMIRQLAALHIPEKSLIDQMKAEMKSIAGNKVVSAQAEKVKVAEEEKATEAYRTKTTILPLIETIFPDASRIGKAMSFEFRRFFFKPEGETVLLGSPVGGLGHKVNETQYEVTFKRTFEMLVVPVTQLLWTVVMKYHYCDAQKEPLQTITVDGKDIELYPNFPIENISWHEAQKFTEALSRLDPVYDYRLPTEAEWEYALRAGTQTPYFFGENSKLLGKYAWYFSNSGLQRHDVGLLLPNDYGMYDMLGSNWEWVQDWYQIERESQQVDPSGPDFGPYKVLRGGQKRDEAIIMRSANRGFAVPGSSSSTSMRLVREPKIK